ncbi:MAG TPA: hypothetical protein VGQ23_16570 [Burkholderiaceae bacterium]|jgi:hypothetical protein|nr:hypothetical protein [Burkholderiaceae bacterium]
MSRAKHPATGQTRTTIHGGATPRLPHESDESSDSQIGASDDLIRQAYEDLRRGLTDTDRGAPMDELYARTLRSKKSKTKTEQKPRPK